MFTKAIVRTPSKSIVNGITSANLGKPNYENALKQHSNYISALKECGVEVTILDANEEFPDSTFVEDTALLTPSCAIITNPGAESRKGEIIEMKKVISDFYSNIECIEAPGTVEAGDVMMVSSHFYIGLSERTNQTGANQMISILEKNGMTGSCIKMNEMLHLKTGLSYLENNNLVVTGEFLTHPEFQKYDRINVDIDEEYSANCIWMNDIVIIPKGFLKSKQKIEAAGYKTIEVDVSEFQKIDGGLSCLSLRF